MGAGIARLVASAGISVNLVDQNEQLTAAGIASISKGLERDVAKERLTPGEMQAILSKVRAASDISVASDADYVIEAIVERVDAKKSLFASLSQTCKPEAILATNTSSLSITEIAAVAAKPERVIGLHFFNPVAVMKLVEIIRGTCTSDKALEAARELVVRLGKMPVEVNEAPGFIVNRLLIPMINEAAFMLNEGVASMEDIDQAMKLGANHPMGPLELGDLIGLDVCLYVMEVLHREFGDPKYRPCPLMRRMVNAGKLGRKSGAGFYDYTIGP
jgi:3-hydroxybutyryl-CoA dehydrogenase